MHDDFLNDVITRLAKAIETTAPGEQRAEALRKVENDLRHTWGGDRVTIRISNEERDARIRAEYQKTRDARAIAARHQLSARHVLRIARRW